MNFNSRHLDRVECLRGAGLLVVLIITAWESRLGFISYWLLLDHLDSRTLDLSIERRARWLASINRKDLTPWQLHKTKSTLLVCSDHLIKD